MDHLLYGPDIELKIKTFHAIRAEVFSSADARTLDFETLDAHKLTPETLKIALMSLPAMGSRRLVHVYRAEKLDKQNLELLTIFLREPHPHVTVVLEAETWDDSAKMRQPLGPLLKKTGSQAPVRSDVFALMNAVQAGDSSTALRALNTLFSDGEQPEKLLGGMAWAWSNKAKARLPEDSYKKGLLLMQEADIALKRSRFPDRDNALEVLVVRLSLLARSKV